jgi:hypothetical protein
VLCWQKFKIMMRRWKIYFDLQVLKFENLNLEFKILFSIAPGPMFASSAWWCGVKEGRPRLAGGRDLARSAPPFRTCRLQRQRPARNETFLFLAATVPSHPNSHVGGAPACRHRQRNATLFPRHDGMRRGRACRRLSCPRLIPPNSLGRCTRDCSHR